MLTVRRILAAAFVLGLGFMQFDAQAAEPKRRAVSPPGTVHPEVWPVVEGPVPRNATIEKQVDELVARMSPEEKVGQIIQASITAISPAEAKAYHIGSILNGGGGWPGDVRKATPNDWLALADSFYEASMDTSNGRLAIPIIWGADAVHGHNNIIGATLFPHNVGLGAMRDPDLIRRIGEVTAAEMAVTGIDWNFSPTVAVSRDDRWGRSYESWSEDPELVRGYAQAMIEGLQGRAGSSTFLGPGKVVATSKHFLGDGGTLGGKDQGDNTSTETQLRDIHGAGYVGAMQAGVQAVMASFNSWHGVKMHGNRLLLTDVLKKQMGFRGIVVGDWNGHGQVPGCTNKSCPQSINAGLDMFMVPEDWKALYENTLAQVRSGEIPASRIDDAVRRILRVKMRAGLFTAGKPSQRPTGGRMELLGSIEHRAVARQAVRESLVLLKNNGSVLPIRSGQKVLVAGDGADNIGKLCGGWTISWQGDGNSNDDFPGATSIWGGIRPAVEMAGGTAVFSPDGSYTEKPDVAVVVFGENPYAEFQGDRQTLIYDSEADLRLLEKLRSAGIRVVSVFLSGRPLWVNPYLNASDAFVAAWLPGTEGAGVADVIVGKSDGTPRNDFRGKLAFSWPKLVGQLVLNKGDKNYEPLFAYGFGLTYKDRVHLPELPVDTAGVSTSRPDVFFAGMPMAPWQLWIDDAGEAREISSGDAVSSARGTVTIRRADGRAQESAREVQWSGNGNGDVYLTAGKPIDLTRESNGNLALSFDVLLRKAPTRPVTLSVGCGADCGGSVDLTPMLRSLAPGQWQTLHVRLRCFSDAGADMAKVQTPFRLSTSGQLTLAFGEVKLIPATDTDATCPRTAGGTMFDDFSYATVDQMEIHGWLVRQEKGWPGVPGAAWGPNSVSLLDDPASAGNRVLRMTSVTGGTPATTRQSQFCHERKYMEGTYAARVRLTDEPVAGPDGDQIVETFYFISPLKAPMDLDYSEVDFEYLPNGGWGHDGATMFATTWETFYPEPEWKAVNQSGSKPGSLSGWHTLVAQVAGGKVRYFVDGSPLADHGGEVYPEEMMSMNFNLWFIRDGLLPAGTTRTWEEDVDWVYHRADVVLTPAEVELAIAAMRRAAIPFTDSVPMPDPPLARPCNF